MVVITITPLAPLAPYKEVVEASFNTVTDLMSFGLMSFNEPENGASSTMYKGASEPFTDPNPRIRIVEELPGCPEVLNTATPAASPAKA